MFQNLPQFFVEQIKALISVRKLRYIKTPSTLADSTTKDVMSRMMNELVQYSMSLANDSYQTSLCLQFSPQEIATACVYLACQFAGVEPVAGGADFKTILGDPNIDAMFSICLQILDLISDKKASDMAIVKKIRVALEVMRSRDQQSAAKQQPSSHHSSPPNSNPFISTSSSAAEQGAKPLP
jgi:hypothetical protein